MRSSRISYTALFFFFFSSRRRHTRFDCDWSSDVCSSDLIVHFFAAENAVKTKLLRITARWSSLVARWAHNPKVGGSNPSRATTTKKSPLRWAFFRLCYPFFSPGRSAGIVQVFMVVGRALLPVGGHAHALGRCAFGQQKATQLGHGAVLARRPDIDRKSTRL